MPFLKCNRGNSRFEEKIDKSKRNGWRGGVYSTHKHPKDKYVGNWSNDQKEGWGYELTRSDYSYKGKWKNGLKHGFGILCKMKKGGTPKKLYAGCWEAGARQGYGIAWYPDCHYKGYFCRNKRHGFGRMWWPDGRYYEGDWQNGLFHGRGLYRNRVGNEYKGQFVEGVKEGEGTYYHVNTGQIQPGLWSGDSCVSSSVEDSRPLRQLASTPTPYPIPPVSTLADFKSTCSKDCPRSEFKLYREKRRAVYVRSCIVEATPDDQADEAR